jgi:hypothetical protein
MKLLEPHDKVGLSEGIRGNVELLLWIMPSQGSFDETVLFEFVKIVPLTEP